MMGNFNDDERYSKEKSGLETSWREGLGLLLIDDKLCDLLDDGRVLQS
jgi:hypothetical protein